MLRAARDEDRDSIIALLDAESLPTSDLATQPLEQFIVAEERGLVVGCIGAEVSICTALLRSLVVARSHRRRQIAGRLVDALENALAAAGVADVWLLTIDADGYFKKRGYLAQNRDVVPASIRKTQEFSSLCPGSAAVMRKQLRSLV